MRPTDESEAAAAQIIIEAAKTDWRAALAFLERRSAKWARKDRLPTPCGLTLRAGPRGTLALEAPAGLVVPVHLVSKLSDVARLLGYEGCVVAVDPRDLLSSHVKPRETDQFGAGTPLRPKGGAAE